MNGPDNKNDGPPVWGSVSSGDDVRPLKVDAPASQEKSVFSFLEDLTQGQKLFIQRLDDLIKEVKKVSDAGVFVETGSGDTLKNLKADFSFEERKLSELGSLNEKFEKFITEWRDRNALLDKKDRTQEQQIEQEKRAVAREIPVSGTSPAEEKEHPILDGIGSFFTGTAELQDSYGLFTNLRKKVSSLRQKLKSKKRVSYETQVAQEAAEKEERERLRKEEKARKVSEVREAIAKEVEKNKQEDARQSPTVKTFSNLSNSLDRVQELFDTLNKKAPEVVSEPPKESSSGLEKAKDLGVVPTVEAKSVSDLAESTKALSETLDKDRALSGPPKVFYDPNDKPFLHPSAMKVPGLPNSPEVEKPPVSDENDFIIRHPEWQMQKYEKPEKAKLTITDTLDKWAKKIGESLRGDKSEYFDDIGSFLTGSDELQDTFGFFTKARQKIADLLAGPEGSKLPTESITEVTDEKGDVLDTNVKTEKTDEDLSEKEYQENNEKVLEQLGLINEQLKRIEDRKPLTKEELTDVLRPKTVTRDIADYKKSGGGSKVATSAGLPRSGKKLTSTLLDSMLGLGGDGDSEGGLWDTAKDVTAYKAGESLFKKIFKKGSKAPTGAAKPGLFKKILTKIPKSGWGKILTLGGVTAAGSGLLSKLWPKKVSTSIPSTVPAPKYSPSTPKSTVSEKTPRILNDKGPLAQRAAERKRIRLSRSTPTTVSASTPNKIGWLKRGLSAASKSKWVLGAGALASGVAAKFWPKSATVTPTVPTPITTKAPVAAPPAKVLVPKSVAGGPPKLNSPKSPQQWRAERRSGFNQRINPTEALTGKSTAKSVTSKALSKTASKLAAVKGAGIVAGKAASRAIPVVGQALMAYDAAATGYGLGSSIEGVISEQQNKGLNQAESYSEWFKNNVAGGDIATRRAEIKDNIKRLKEENETITNKKLIEANNRKIAIEEETYKKLGEQFEARVQSNKDQSLLDPSRYKTRDEVITAREEIKKRISALVSENEEFAGLDDPRAQLLIDKNKKTIQGYIEKDKALESIGFSLMKKPKATTQSDQVQTFGKGLNPIKTTLSESNIVRNAIPESVNLGSLKAAPKTVTTTPKLEKSPLGTTTSILDKSFVPVPDFARPTKGRAETSTSEYQLPRSAAKNVIEKEKRDREEQRKSIQNLVLNGNPSASSTVKIVDRRTSLSDPELLLVNLTLF